MTFFRTDLWSTGDKPQPGLWSKGGIAMNEQLEPETDQAGARQGAEPRVPTSETPAKTRPAYLDPNGSESTRELRDTARRRRDAEEKLQQHLMEAKEHAHDHDADHPGDEFHEGRRRDGDDPGSAS
jgi:hypothetical protein